MIEINKAIELIQNECPGAKPLFLIVSGSIAYGTNLPTSDIDIRGVFIQSIDDILGNKYLEQINDDNNDIVIYEVRRFLELLEKNNPTVLELLNAPEDCIYFKDPVFDLILNNSNKFITKICANSFGGYARMQIQKAKGQNKKQNWERDKVTRKDIIDFVYVIEGEKSIPWREWNKDRYDEKFCGVVNVPNARDVYAIFYDTIASHLFSEKVPQNVRNAAKEIRKESNLHMGLGYKGLVKDGEEVSNQLRLSSVPKGETPICNIIYNKDGYTKHCMEYKSYVTWLEKRNEARWVDVKSHGQKIDGKNMLHCKRLLDMSIEIAEGKGIIVRRPNAKELLSIRKGEVNLETLIQNAEKDIQEIDRLFKDSNLPDSVDPEFIHNLLLQVRTMFYEKSKN